MGGGRVYFWLRFDDNAKDMMFESCSEEVTDFNVPQEVFYEAFNFVPMTE